MLIAFIQDTDDFRAGEEAYIEHSEGDRLVKAGVAIEVDIEEAEANKQEELTK